MTHRLSISNVAEKYLTGWLEAVMAGEIPLWRLPPSVAAFYFAGYAEGRASRQPEIDHLERVTNYLHYMHLSDQERRADIEERLVSRLEQFSVNDWDELEEVLHHLAVENGGEGIDAANDAEIEGSHDGIPRTTDPRRKAA